MPGGKSMAQITNEVLSAKLDATSAQIGEVKAQIAAFGTVYARSDLLDLRFKEVDAQIVTIKLEIAKVVKDTQKVSWKSHTLTAIFTAALVLLVTYVFNDVIGK